MALPPLEVTAGQSTPSQSYGSMPSAGKYLSQAAFGAAALTAISAATIEPAKALVLDRGNPAVCRLVNPQDVTGITHFADVYSMVNPREWGIAVRGKPYFGMLQESAPHILAYFHKNEGKIGKALKKIAGEHVAQDFLNEGLRNHTNLGQGLYFSDGGNTETMAKKLEHNLTAEMARKLKNSTGIECVMRVNEFRQNVGIVFSTGVYFTLGAAMRGGGGGTSISSAPTPPVCFTADTKVLMADGRLKPIVKIKKGEKVQSFNFMTNRRVRSKVTRLFQFQSQSHLVLNGALKVTEKHPFAVGMDSWREAGELKKGDIVLGKRDIALKSIQKVVRATPVFNLTVEGHHNYYVSDGKEEFLVHNKAIIGCFIKGTKIKMANGSLRKIEQIKVGDQVKGFDIRNRKWKTCPVTERQIKKNALGFYLINKKMKVSPVHKIYVNGRGKTPTEITLGDTLSDGRKRVRVTSIELVKKRADRHNIVIGRNAEVAYLADGTLVMNGW
ncbi:TPA: hypothetical protein HA281_04115 [Candidatus Woesearchaeota archaeon]|nr:hypothetical protein [Candidatus Woesearchaeota archaeon]